MRCPVCDRELRVYKKIKGEIHGKVDVWFANDVDKDVEGMQEWNGGESIERIWDSPNYFCECCDSKIEPQLVYNHFKQGEENNEW